jgi:hypothetical protein
MRIKTILHAVLVVLVGLLAGSPIYVFLLHYHPVQRAHCFGVERATGQLTINGRWRWRFAHADAYHQDLSLADLPGGSGQMITLKRLEVQLQLYRCSRGR